MVAGVLVDLFGTFAVVVLYLAGLLLHQLWRGDGVPDVEVSEGHIYFLDTVGQLATLIGGFVAARLAVTRPTLHGAAVGVIAALGTVPLSFLFNDAGSSVAFSTTDLPSMLVAVAMGLAGGYIASRRALSRIRTPPSTL